MGKRIIRLEKRIAAMGKRIIRLEKRIAAMGKRIIRLEKRIAAMGKRIIRLVNAFPRVVNAFPRVVNAFPRVVNAFPRRVIRFLRRVFRFSPRVNGVIVGVRGIVARGSAVPRAEIAPTPEVVASRRRASRFTRAGMAPGGRVNPVGARGILFTRLASPKNDSSNGWREGGLVLSAATWASSSAERPCGVVPSGPHDDRSWPSRAHCR